MPEEANLNSRTIEQIEYKYLNLLNNSLGNSTQLKKELESQNKLKSEFASIAAKLSQVSGVSIKTLHKRITWLCKIDSLTMNDAINYVEEHLLSTRSYKQGILVNPIYETYEILR